MRRREFVLAAGVAAAWPAAGRAQQASKIPLIGMLWVNSAEAERKIGFVAALHVALTDLGYVDGKTIRVEERFGDGGYRRMEELAAELIRLNVDLIVTGAEGANAAAHATKTIPIVTATSGDPVAEGLVASLAHPGGNFTGNAVFFPQIMAKRLELLKQTLPSLARVGVLAPKTDDFVRLSIEVMTATAKPLDVDLQVVEAADATAYERAFSAAAAGGLVVLDHPLFFRDFAAIAALAQKYRLLAAGAPPFARAGGLIGYGVLFPVLFRGAAVFVDKILNGAKPGDIPIEQATKFETVVNLKTAGALGLNLPPTLLAAADEVIE